MANKIITNTTNEQFPDSPVLRFTGSRLADNQVSHSLIHRFSGSTPTHYNWYVINTNPRCEEMVCALLGQWDFEVFLPKLRNSRTGRSEPLFPGYLFVRLNLSLPDWVKIKYLHGVRKILSYGDSLIPVPDTFIEEIKGGISSEYFIKAMALKAGDKVRFLKGPFAGLEGIFTGEISGNDRVKILLSAIHNWSFKVEATAGEISRVS